MKQSTRIWLLAGIMVIASFLRLYHITSTPPGLYPDEAMDGNNALEVIQTGHFQPFYVEDNGREGLYVNILVFFIKALGNKPWVVRLPAAIAGIFTVLGICFLVLELFSAEASKKQAPNAKQYQDSNGPNAESKNLGLWNVKFGASRGDLIALLASFLLATSFWHINFSRIGFRAILAPLCLIWALYWFLKAIRSANSAKTWLYTVAAGAIFGAGFYTYIAYRITPLLFLLFIPFFKKSPGFWKRTLLFVLIVFVIALPIGIYFARHPADFFGRTSEISVTSSAHPLKDFATNILKTALMFNFHGDNNWRQNVSGAPELWWPVGILFLIGILWSLNFLLQGIRKKLQIASSKFQVNSNDPNDKLEKSGFWELEFGICLIGLWFLLAGLPAVISDEGIPHALRSILMLPPAIMLAAIGGVWLYDRVLALGSRAWTKTINVLAIVFIISVAVFGYVDYFIIWGQNPNVPGAFNADYVAIGDQMNALPQSTQKYVVVNAGGVLARGIPVPAETVMFVTDSFTTSTQISNHITYLLPDQADQIPIGTPSGTIFEIN